VRDEVEENLLFHASALSAIAAEKLIEDYRRLIELTRPEVVEFPPVEEVRANRKIIRHEADVPVLLSAMKAKPDWLLTHNTKHFTPAVTQRTGLRIATPVEFLRCCRGCCGKSAKRDADSNANLRGGQRIGGSERSIWFSSHGLHCHGVGCVLVLEIEAEIGARELWCCSDCATNSCNYFS
jgi:hypothetical protein